MGGTQGTIKTQLLQNQGKRISKGLWGVHSITQVTNTLHPRTSQRWFPTFALTPCSLYTPAHISRAVPGKGQGSRTWMQDFRLVWAMQLSQPRVWETMFYQNYLSWPETNSSSPNLSVPSTLGWQINPSCHHCAGQVYPWLKINKFSLHMREKTPQHDTTF